MPCTIRDASFLTAQRRNKALNSYKNDWLTQVNARNQSLKAPAITGAEVVAEIKLGCVACNAASNEALKNSGAAYDANVSLYPANRSSGGAHGLTGTS